MSYGFCREKNPKNSGWDGLVKKLRDQFTSFDHILLQLNLSIRTRIYNKQSNEKHKKIDFPLQ
jgi:hypothetical protein